jgi:4-hydroxy-3-methylbut-2-enyl diphosphate reductase
MQQALNFSRSAGVSGRPQRPLTSRKPVVVLNAASTEATGKVDGRSIRRSLNQTGRYVRTPSNDKQSQELMDEHGVGYSSMGLVAQMRDANNQWQQGEVTVKLAKAYGYCWGVERAVRMAYEARKSFPEKQIFITNEIIHNPEVNKRLREMDIEIVEEKKTGKDYSTINDGAVVIFPAFGATVQEMQLFKEKGVQMVDTTCPWVTKVWNSVDTHTKKSFTSVIHGKYSHEETVATASFATKYAIVKDMKQAEWLCNFVTNGGTNEEFFAEFDLKAYSVGFDPQVDLIRVGLANQTTMMKNETLGIGKLLERTMLSKYGPDKINEHFLLMETICDATQERQDALYEITDDKSIDMLIVVGGFNSSNTCHLQEIAENKNMPSFWVDSAACIDVAANMITHKTGWGELKETFGWLPAGKMTIGVTSGASTPDRSLEEVMDKVFKIKDPAFSGITSKECSPFIPPDH